MKKIFLLFLGACALTACNSDDNAIEPKPVPTPEKVSMELIAESSENRTYLGDDNIVHFMADDQLSVFDGTDNNKFTLSSRNNDTDAKKQYKSASFSGKAADPAENLYVLYPYQSDATFSAGEITATLPATQTLTPLKADADNPDGVASGFDPAASLSVAKVSADKTFVLKNIGALIKFIVPEGQTYTKAIFQGNNNEDVAGKITVSNITGDPTYTVVEGSKTITMAGTFTAGTYYMVVLPQTYSKGFSLTLTNVEEDAISGKAAKQSVPLSRKKVMNMGTMTTENNMYFGHEFVDIGTTVGGKKVYWATMNIGASKVEESGDYFAWGMTEPCYESYSWDDEKGAQITWGSKSFDWPYYLYCNGTYSKMTKYNASDQKTVLEPEDDAAHVLWGGEWRIPTVEDANALLALAGKGIEWQYPTGTKPNGCFVWKNTETSKELKFCKTGIYDQKASHGVYTRQVCAFNVLSNSVTGYRCRHFYQATNGKSVSSDFFRCYGAPIRPVFTLE